VGGNVPLRANVRLITATNKDLTKEIDIGRFREDLWYRLNIFPIQIPPLRERSEDILLLMNWFITRYNNKIGKQTFWIDPAELNKLQHYTWPGNVRELENLIERAIITSPDGELKIEMPTQKILLATKQMTMREHERKIIIDTLESVFWKIEGTDGAAQRLDLNPSTLRSRMRKLGIRKHALSKL
jgi:chemotaxis protein methyltransferase CheR